VERLEHFLSKFDSNIFVKIDTQGTELKILAGAGHLIQKISAIQLEIGLYRFYDSQPSLIDTLLAIEELGFVLGVIDPFGYYDPHEPCRLFEMDCTFIRVQ
jgi:hypothetical protein